MRRRLISLVLGASLFALPASGQTDCGWNPDFDGDNHIGVADLLGLLGVFEEQDSDDDGIWDSQDDCVGIVDSCGVCAGPGPDFPVILSIEVTYDSVFIPQIEEWYVFELSIDTTFIYVCQTLGCMDSEATNYNPAANVDDGSCSYGPPECGGVTTITFNGHTYDLVAIGTQCWFAENLRTEHYANGDPIPGNLSDSEWSSTTSGAQANCGEGNSASDDDCEETNPDAYGRLYNWYAVVDSRSLCPSGWHVPTDEEWITLEMELGMSAFDAHSYGGWRGTDEGDKLKSSPTDNPSWNGTNITGFSALPSGLRDHHGGLGSFGLWGYWWSSSSFGGSLAGFYRFVYSDYPNFFRDNYYSARAGMAIRCLKNAL